MSLKEIGKNGFRAFIPYQLEIDGRPELSNFPIQVAFMSFMVKEGKNISGTALYEPDLLTYSKDGYMGSMQYHNIIGGDCRLVITYDEENKKYCGEKIINGKVIVAAYGGDNWDNFFTHLTMGGLENGERCMFEQM